MESDARYERAKRRVEEIKGFYVHVLVFLTVNAGLFVIDLVASRDSTWFYWPLLGWGIALALHAVALVTEGGLFGPEWEERKARKILERDEQHVSDHAA